MPRSVQQSIPIDRIYADGVWQSGNVFSRMWQISDINYAMQSDAAKQNILTQLGTLYAGIPADCWMQVCIVSQRMHEITYEVEEVDITPEPTEDDPDPEQQTEYILHLTVSSKTVDELAELYNFTQDQKDILHELLSDEMRPTLLALCGGSIGIIEDGELCWPLPGHTYISCNFGEEDAYGNSGHRGTDIPAPEGTPILAAHGGTVIISGWNNSYGNQVLLDNGAGLSTRYAHMTAAAVSAGETVTAGQVIGYVGNTGDSTGFHLHFEVMQNGVRVNPLDAVTPQ